MIRAILLLVYIWTVSDSFSFSVHGSTNSTAYSSSDSKSSRALLFPTDHGKLYPELDIHIYMHISSSSDSLSVISLLQLILLRIAGIILPIYIIMKAITGILRRRHNQVRLLYHMVRTHMV